MACGVYLVFSVFVSDQMVRPASRSAGSQAFARKLFAAIGLPDSVGKTRLASEAGQRGCQSNTKSVTTLESSMVRRAARDLTGPMVPRFVGPLANDNVVCMKVIPCEPAEF